MHNEHHYYHNLKMKLQLCNFRCWKNQTFDFPDSGITLLSAASGHGKSSLFIAINWVLYGKEKQTTTFGSTTSSVVFEYHDFKIQRTRTPSTLTLTNKTSTYHDDAAQGVINEYFGLNFETTCYISQKFVCCFLNTTTADKMKILEQLFVQDDDIEKIKSRTCDMIADCRIQHTENEAVLQSYQRDLNTATCPEQVAFPLAKKYHPTHVKNEQILARKCNKKLTSQRDVLAQLNIQHHQATQSKTLHQQLTQQLYQHQLEREQINTQITNINYDATETKLIQIAITTKQNQHKLATLQLQHHEMITTTQSLIDAQLIEWNDIIIKSQLQLTTSTSHHDIEEMQIQQISIQRKNTLCAQVTELQKSVDNNTSCDVNAKIQDITQQLQDLTSQHDIMACPKCKSGLRLVKNKLHQAADVVIDNIDSKISYLKSQHNILTAELQMYQEKVHKITTIQNIKKIIDKIQITTNLSLSELQKLITTEIQNQHRCSMLNKTISTTQQLITSQKYPQVIHTRTIQATKLQHEIKELLLQKTPEQTGYEDNELDDLIQAFHDDKIKAEKLQLLTSQLYNIDTKISCITTQLSNLIYDNTDYQHEITKLSQDIQQLELTSQQHTQKEVLMREYDAIQQYRTKYQEMKQKVQECNTDSIISRNKLANVILFDKKIQQAQSLMLQNMIEMLNYHINIYLTEFFQDDPLTFEMTSFKETRTVGSKPGIDIKIHYAGEIMEPKSLSGGQYDRCCLAIVLAFNDVFKGKILMLDESISSLDAQASSNIIKVLHHTIKNKLVIIVAHQIEHGYFDSVVDLTTFKK